MSLLAAKLFSRAHIVNLPNPEMQRLRRKMQIVFQDPHASLNPRMSILSDSVEPLKIHGVNGKQSKSTGCGVAFKGRPIPKYMKLSHEFSGGQRQRIGIACARFETRTDHLRRPFRP
jgi:ABC-type microcin C transport system duplicated ATPase subunit YejF